MKNITIIKNHRKELKQNGKRTLKQLMNLRYKIELTPIPQKNGGGFFASIPLLIGCQSDGSSPDEAITNLREAQRAWFESALKHNDVIPIPQ